MMHPTGACSLVADLIKHSRTTEKMLETFIEAEDWNGAIDCKIDVESLKARAGMEFLLWALAVLNMPAEPTAWEMISADEVRKKAANAVSRTSESGNKDAE